MGDPPPEGAEERLGGPEEQLAISFLSSGAKRGSEYIFVGPPFSHPAFRRISAHPNRFSSELSHAATLSLPCPTPRGDVTST